MLVRDLMVQPPAIVHQDTPLGEVVQLMLARHLTCVAVVDDRGRLCGLIGEEDFLPRERLFPFSTERLPRLFGEWLSRRHVELAYTEARGLKAKEVMTPPTIVITGDTPLEEALLQLEWARCLPVVQSETPIGTLSHREVLLMMT